MALFSNFASGVAQAGGMESLRKLLQAGKPGQQPQAGQRGQIRRGRKEAMPPRPTTPPLPRAPVVGRPAEGLATPPVVPTRPRPDIGIGGYGNWGG